MTTTDDDVTWGDWLGSWKHGSLVDEESERIDRQRAAFGGDTVARIKDLNVLIVGCRGVGVETAKNLILSNVGAVVLVDDVASQIQDLGSNFYLQQANVQQGTSRAEACLGHLKSLNPYCKVEVCPSSDMMDMVSSNNILGTGKPFGAIVVTDLMPKSRLFQLNETARSNHMAFLLAINKGVSSSLFSDFGPHHEITDKNGEPTQMLAVSNMEVLTEIPSILKMDGFRSNKVVIVTVASQDHGLDNGDLVVLDDMREELSRFNGKQYKVKRVAFVSPAAAKIDTQDVAFQEALKQSTAKVLQNFTRQYNFYKEQHGDDTKKFQTRTITMFNRLALVLDDDHDDDAYDLIATHYEAGGLLNQVRPTIVQEYDSLEQTLVSTPVPQMLRGEHWEGGKGIEVHLSIAAVLEFQESSGHWPRLYHEEDAKAVLELARSISKFRQDSAADSSCWSRVVSFGFPTDEARDLDETRILRFAKLYETELTGFCAFLGGAAAQEVLKKTGKFTPISQWVHHDEQVLVMDESPNNTMPPSMLGSRYDFQIAVMGKDFMHRVANQRVFLVGCGALGCEYLKGLSLMGVGTGKNGMIHVTDMDRIEVSNLSRQFLFRDSDVGSPKSKSGARVVKEWNPQVNIVALEKKVGPDTEDFFNDDFWESLNVCWNALDNVAARKYTDSQCLFYSKPLLESGTLGTKCNHEVILPFRTSTYNDGKESDDNENQIAMCTLRSFPYLPLHCIEFAKQAYFSDYFEFGPDQYETFRKDMASFFEQLDSMEAEEQIKSLSMIHFYIEKQKEGNTILFENCVWIAFDRMVEDFRTSVLNLCHAADAMEASSGEKFWTGTKRRPRAIDWNPADPAPELMEYLYCTTNMYAVVWGLDPVRDRKQFEEIVASLKLVQPEWSPSSEKVDLNEDDNAVEGRDRSEEADKLKADLYSVDVSSLQKAFPHDFEKDDDANFHIDFLTVATNLRAWNYDIKASQRHTVKVTAGRIIPALATTTAMVCGLVDIEFCKLVLGLESMGRDSFLNSNINLAAGSGNFTTYSPDPPVPLKTGLEAPHPQVFSSWDKIEITCEPTNEMSVSQLVDYIEKSLDVTVNRIFAFGSTADKAIYNASNKQRLQWEITIDAETGKPTVSDGVYGQWPQIKMAVQMLTRLPPSSGQRKIFEGQINTVKQALDKTKESFVHVFEGPVSSAYRQEYEPADEKERQYFDSVFEERNYLKLGVDCHTNDGTDIHLPCIKYTYSSDSGDRAVKRHKLES